MNDDFKDIGAMIESKNSIYIVPHIMMDGDAMGSAAALCRALRKKKKTAWVLTEDKIPDNLMFLDEGLTTDDAEKIESPDLCVLLDCGEESRYPKRKDAVAKSGKIICLDHHATSKAVFDMNHIDTEAAATGEIVYDLLCEMKVDMDKDIGEAIFAAITTDTGNFQYSNTTRRSHEIVAELYDLGIDHNKVSIEIYQSEPVEKIKLHGMVLGDIKIFGEGKAAIAKVTQDMLRKTGARMEDSEGLVSKLRDIKGVEIAALLKEQPDGEIKVTMRAKEYADVSKIAQKHNGGGHVKAAGCSLNCKTEEAQDIIENEICRELEDKRHNKYR